MAQQAFPILSVDEMLRDAAELQCPLNRDDLTHPTPARVQAIYEWFMWRLLGLNSEAIKNAVDEQLAVMEHPVRPLVLEVEGPPRDEARCRRLVAEAC